MTGLTPKPEPLTHLGKRLDAEIRQHTETFIFIVAPLTGSVLLVFRIKDALVTALNPLFKDFVAAHLVARLPDEVVVELAHIRKENTQGLYVETVAFGIFELAQLTVRRVLKLFVHAGLRHKLCQRDAPKRRQICGIVAQIVHKTIRTALVSEARATAAGFVLVRRHEANVRLARHHCI